MMQKSPDDTSTPSRPTSRRSSVSLPRRNSLKKEKDKKLVSSAHSTPRKSNKPLEFMVTGRQILKNSDRANSLPGSSRRPADSVRKKPSDLAQKTSIPPARSRDPSVEEDMSLDLSQVSDFEDSFSKYGLHSKFSALATSTPKPRGKPRAGSLQPAASQRSEASTKSQQSLDESRESGRESESGRDSALTCSLPYRYPEEYSLVSPGGSASSASPHTVDTPRSPPASSCYVSSWQDSDDTMLQEADWPPAWPRPRAGPVATPRGYDPCPTPYAHTIRFNEFDLTDETLKRSPTSIININNIIKNEGLHLTPRETQNIIQCTHILGSVFSKAIERRSKLYEAQKFTELNEEKRKNLTLNLKETAIPLEVKEEKRSETVTTQTDISLPNTKSAPRIFESILRQLSKSSIDEDGDKEEGSKEVANE